MFRRILRILLIIAFTGLGLGLSYYYMPDKLAGFAISTPATRYGFMGIAAAASGLMGVFLAPSIVEGFIRVTLWLEQILNKMSIQEIVGGVVGLIIGLIIATLLGAAVSWLPWIGGFLKVFVTLVLGYVGVSVGMKRKEELLGFLPRFSKDKPTKTEAKTAQSSKILDTSVIIDGRIADICKSGFIEGPLVIPGFILEELRHIADSSDLLKRNRGRRGLDILNKIRKELDVMVKIHEQDFEELSEVDSKLVKLAQVLNGKIITNDYNLNKVAELQGVKVLNINELANALKPVVLPGEEMTVQIIKDGKEIGQGVAYLDDGTMIVVDSGKKHIGQTIGVIVTSVLQTAAGRMIFAKPKAAEKRSADQDPPSSFDEVNLIG
ncbi:MAG: PIN domain nuclease [Firmicutes bacterium HGW-Firmicutes-14]|nr:MAG: PIN domain nuclease [Firmicutes bacterium HGW-Firmicutes-14]